MRAALQYLLIHISQGYRVCHDSLPIPGALLEVYPSWAVARKWRDSNAVDVLYERPV
jgi:hypothetical protein